MLASLLSHGRGFGKLLLLRASLTLTPSSITNTQTVNFKVGKKAATNLPWLFLYGFAVLLSAVKTSLHAQAAAFSCCSCFSVSPVPGWEGRKPSKWTIPASQTAPARLWSWGIPQEAFRRVEKAETRSRASSLKLCWGEELRVFEGVAGWISLAGFGVWLYYMAVLSIYFKGAWSLVNLHT